MTTENQDSKKTTTDAAHREALQYWGFLIKEDRCGTDMLDRLLKGIATVISTKFEPHDCSDLKPTQLAAFYRAVGGDYDVLFVETPPSSISFIYRALGALHSLQPTPEDDGYSAPTVPALKAKGFVTWQTIQLLLGPEEHARFLQKAVELFDVKDPLTGQVFPKLLPKECFPDRPDEAMEEWYQSVAERLKREAEMETAGKEETARVRVEVRDDGPRSSSEISEEERRGAASYFSDPLYRRERPRAGYARQYSKQASYSEDWGGVVGRVRHMLNPFHRDRRKDRPRRDTDEEYSDDSLDATPLASVPPPIHHHTYAPPERKRPHAPRREGSASTSDSDSESDRPRLYRTSPVLRHRRSHPPSSPPEYFPAYYGERERRYSHDTKPDPRRKQADGPPPPLYGPTKSPLFATHVAQLQAHAYGYERRSAAGPARTSNRPEEIRYVAKVSDTDGGYARERERPRERDRERERGRDKYNSPSSRCSRPYEDERRRSDGYPEERMGVRGDMLRTRSHDRVKDGWDEREHSKERGRDGRVRARYVGGAGGVQDGVGGRRYAAEPPWR
ncbi:uncharacterized protein EI97DRAFT_428737 [Westerdykella ornata]|uniref:DUF7514 domain-containing protein n=1 Tax=Westerdykella ornata TaxID=318751 RepID=A0A6A6JVK9_WESOR|nr:uncharacterized protein EI97DRAFT_428737 [Westerdykella ornata]KAF2280640.1 hypothetical protein EI97DRAFT_428737 [Westerdykella ornata]